MKKVLSKSTHIFYGWWVVLAGSSIYFLGIGTVFYGFNVFFVPMIKEFGWSRTITAGAYSLSRLEGGLEGPFIGWLIDKFGAQKLIFIGVILVGIGFIALSFIQNALGFYLIFGLLISLGYNTGFYHATTTATANWFIKKRSRALSFITVGGGLGGAVMVSVLALLISHYGWRAASVITGLGMFVLGIPIAFAIKSKPEDVGLLPDNAAPEKDSESTQTANSFEEHGTPVSLTTDDEVNYTVKEALQTKAFWSYAFAMMLRSCILSAVVVHQIPHLVDVGISYATAAACLSLMILSSIPGRLIFGWMGDIFDMRRLLFIACILQALGIWIFININALWMAYIFVAIYGFGYGGAIPLTIALRGKLFGRKIFGTIGGITSAMTAVATVASPVLSGYIYDISGSYSIAFYTLMILIFSSGFAFLMIRLPKPKTSPVESCATG
ncbi:MAG: MFS transporter [Thermodesulfobacteriota bacterium]|nr:MFS transporter [Thermodesulfobacteriota bacterium]